MGDRHYKELNEENISSWQLHYFEGNHKGDGNNACEVRNAGHQNQFDLA